MEAIAKHDFTATADDELSFKRGQVLKVGSFLTYKSTHLRCSNNASLCMKYISDSKYGR